MLAFVFVLGIALGLSVLNVKFKDVEFIWGILLHAGFFLTPIFYQFDMLPEQIQNILQLSPIVQIVEMVHHVTLYGTLPSLNSVLYSVGSVFGVLGIGYLIFRRYQARIVEDM
jgi:lipopolysaccharide transport system permease protein